MASTAGRKTKTKWKKLSEGKKPKGKKDPVKEAVEAKKKGKDTAKAKKGQGKVPRKPKEAKETHITIQCCDCPATRVIKVQDRHQVKRCEKCQAEFRKVQRRGYRKNRIKAMQEQIETKDAQIAKQDEQIGKLIAKIDKLESK